MAEESAINDGMRGHFGAPIVLTQVILRPASEMGCSNASYGQINTHECSRLASGDVDVIQTKLQLILPCLESAKVLSSIGSERISLTAETPTVAERVHSLDVEL